MINKLLFLKKIIISPLFVSVIFFLLLQLPIFNFGFNFRDEGYLLNNAQRILNGELPYVNFALSITPGAFYIQALIFKLFGNFVITDRILYILCVILVLILSSKLFRFTKFLNYLSLIFLGIFYTGLGVFASYNMYGVLFVMLTLFLFNKLSLNNKFYWYSFLVGFSNSLVFAIKQTYGFVFFLSLLFMLAIFINHKYRFKNILFYLMGSLFLPITIFLIFYFSGILNKFIYNILYFALAVKNDRLPFILTSILFIPFFIFIVNFVKKISLRKVLIAGILFAFFIGVYILISPTRIPYLSTFYNDPTIYYYLLFFMIPLTLITLFFKSDDKDKKTLIFLSIEAISLFLASAFSGRDYTTVVVASPLYIPLFMYLFIYLFKDLKLRSKNFSIIFLLTIFALPSIFSLLGAYNRVYGEDFKKDSYRKLNIKEMRYINIPISQKNDLEETINYIKNKTSSDIKLLCFPYCSFPQFLSNRGDVSYFNFFYKFMPENQIRVIKDLNNSKNVTILIQKPGPIEKEALYEDEKLKILKQYVLSNYKLKKNTQNFYIYEK
jgi:hypothetical protein